MLDPALDPDLLHIPEVDLNHSLTAEHLPYMNLTYPFGKDKLLDSLSIKEIFPRNVVSRLRGMPNLNKFFEACGIPQYVWKNAQKDSKIEPAEVAEYSAIEQALSTWWISNKAKPLYWKFDQLQAGFEELDIGRFSETCLKDTPNGSLIS